MPKLAVDFSDTEARSGGQSFHFPPDDYPVQVMKAEMGKSANKGTPQVTFTLAVTEGKYKGKKIRYDCFLLPQSLWTLRNLLEAAGKTVPQKRINLDTDKLKGLKFAVTIEDDEYEGKMRSKVTDTFSLKELSASATKDDDEDLAAEDEDEDEVEETDEEEVEEVDLEDI